MSRKKANELSHFQKVGEFHRVFGHPVNATPVMPDVKTAKLRMNLILEEVAEYVEAHIEENPLKAYLVRVADTLRRAIEMVRLAPDYEFRTADLTGVADALFDLEYVTLGAGQCYGFDMDALFEEGHGSNMSKVGEDGKPIYDEHGKIKKGPGYRKPDFARVLWPDQTSDKELAT